ncbi:MAG: hypothetical protein SFW09_13005 [Hyphomicrobiaceae bacterium]|nr:hypothetical protein [Hyphomicrobiaceae bacterium]
MIELRRVRFESIQGLRRDDLGTAGEIWLADLCAAVWATREAMKLGAHLVRYMVAPDPKLLTLSSIEGQIQIGREDVQFALRLLKLYRAVEDFTIEGDELRVALHLTSVQRLKVLEVRHRLAELMRAAAAEIQPSGRWVPAVTRNTEGQDELR